MYKVKRVVIGENKTFVGGEDYLKSKGIEVVVLNDQDCQDLMKKFIEEKPGDWYEDIGEDE
jgi:creatinine deaminase